MRKMKDSGVEWIGEIPENWDTIKLKYLADSVNERSQNNDNYLGLENVEGWTGKYLPSPNDAFVAEGASIMVRKDDVLFGKLRPYLAKCYIAKEDGCCSTEFIVLRNIKIEQKYLWYLMLSPMFIEEVNMSTYGAKMPRASWNFIGNMRFPYPNMEQQKMIIKYLDEKCSKIDTIIARQEEIIEKLKEYKLSIITETVTRGINPDVELKESGVEWIGSVPIDTEVSCFKRYCTVNQGLQIAQSKRFMENSENRYPYITVKYLNTVDKDSAVEYIENPPNSTICKEEDVLMARTGATGLVVTGISGCFHNNFFRINYDKEKLWHDYLVYYLMQDCIKSYLLLMAGTTTIPDLNHGDFFSTPLLIHSLEKQKEISAYLDMKCKEINFVINKKNDIVSKLQEYKKSLIYEVVTGKKEM